MGVYSLEQKFFPLRVEVSLSRQAKRNPQNLILFVKMTKKHGDFIVHYDLHFDVRKSVFSSPEP